MQLVLVRQLDYHRWYHPFATTSVLSFSPCSLYIALLSTVGLSCRLVVVSTARR